MPANVTTAAVAVATVLALALFAVSVVSYRRVQSTRFLMLSGAFGLFLGKGLFLSAGLFTVSVEQVGLLLAGAAVVDALILAVLYGALVKR